MSEQIEYSLAGVDPETRRPLSVRGGFALPPEPGQPAELLARCMVCNVQTSGRADTISPRDTSGKLALARKLLRTAGCPHVREV